MKTRSAADLLARKNGARKGAQGPPRLDPLTGQPLPPRGAKFNNQPCYDQEGRRSPSLAERDVMLAFKDAWGRGDCSEPRRQTYRFDLEDPSGETVHVGKYTSDVEIEAYRDFSIATKAAVYSFQAGQKYTIDVKSPATKTQATDLRFKLMRAVYGIIVLEIFTRPPARLKAKAKATAKSGRSEREGHSLCCD